MAITISELADVKWKGYTETANDLIVTRVFTGQATPDTSRAALLGLRGTEISNYGYYSGHRILVGAGNGKGGKYDVIELTTVDLNVTWQQGYYSTFTASANVATLPLERKTIKSGTTDDTYLTWWNYDTRGSDKLPDLDEDNKDAIKVIDDGVMDSILGDVGYYFAKTNQARKTGEKIFLAAKKPGTQSFLYPTNEVQENVYARDKSLMLRFMSLQGRLLIPVNHANEPFDSDRSEPEDYSDKWLVTSVTYKKVLGWYEGTIRYKYSDQGWDTELYAEPSL